VTDIQIKATDKKLDRVTALFENVANNQGLLVEEFFYQSLIKKNCIGNLCFDDVTKNMEKHRGDLQEEFDLFLTNGESIAIIEVKQKAHLKDLDILKRKVKNFKKLYPIYKDYKLYAGLATYHIYEEAKKTILDAGYFILQKSGNFVYTEKAEHLKIA